MSKKHTMPAVQAVPASHHPAEGRRVRRPLATMSEVTNFLQVSPATVRRMVRRGDLKAVRLSSRAVRFEWSAVETLLVPIEQDEVDDFITDQLGGRA